MDTAKKLAEALRALRGNVDGVLTQHGERLLAQVDEALSEFDSTPAAADAPTMLNGLTEAEASATPSVAGLASAPEPVTDERKSAEHAYATSAFDYPSAPIGSRDWCLFWDGWQARAAIAASQPAPVTLKDHEVREVISAVTQVAQQYGQTQQLRERLKDVLFPVLKRVPARVEAKAVPVGEVVSMAGGHAKAAVRLYPNADRLSSGAQRYTVAPSESAARKPLTNEQVQHLQEKYVGFPSAAYPLTPGDWINFARAVERAHGITDAALQQKEPQ